MAVERSAATQQEKYIAFKTAYDILKHYEATANYIAAYVIAFSILEDRIKAMYAVGFMHKENCKANPNDFNRGFVSLVNKITHWQFLSEGLAAELRIEADNRNKFLHAAMWKLDAFTLEALVRVKKLVRDVEKARSAQKKIKKAMS